MIKVGQTTTNQTIALPYELTNDGDTSFSLNELPGNTTQNGTPTPTSPQQVKVVKGNKNILDNTQGTTQTINGITFTKNSDGTLTANGTATAGVTYYVNGSDSRWQQIPPATYVLSDGTSSPSSSTYFTYLDIQGQDGLYLSTMSTKTRTYSSYYFCRARIVIRNGVTLNNLVFKIQLEQGSTATSYTPYNTIQAKITNGTETKTYPITLGDIELCKIGTYQDRIYKQNGKWYLEKRVGKVVLNGTENWQVLANVSLHSYYVDNFANALSTTSTKNYYSNYFSAIKTDDRYVDNTFFINALSRIIITYNSASSLADFKTWLGTHNTIVYYVLATPTTTEITDETLLEQLEAIGELYRGTNNIMITDTIAPVENIIIEKSNAEFDLVPYIKREPKLDYIDRKGDTGYTADGHYFENIIARKRAVEFELIPMSQEDYANVISRFMNITSIPVFISDTYTNQNLKLNMFKKAIISNTQLTEYGRIRGTKISLEEI